MAADSIRGCVNDSNVDTLIRDPKRRSEIKCKMKRMREARAERDYVVLLYFKEILEAAAHFGKLPISQGDIDQISKVRTLVCHAATDVLVESHNQVRRLISTRSICLELLLPGEGA